MEGIFKRKEHRHGLVSTDAGTAATERSHVLLGEKDESGAVSDSEMLGRSVGRSADMAASGVVRHCDSFDTVLAAGLVAALSEPQG